MGRSYRVKHVNNGSEEFHPVDSVKAGERLIKMLVRRHEIDDASLEDLLGLEVFDEDGWETWEDEEGETIYAFLRGTTG